MVNRVTTPGNYAAILSNLLAAQQRQQEAGNRVATQRNGDNLKDYAKSAELLTAMRAVQTRLGVFQDQNQLLADKLSTQDSGLMRVADAAQSVRQIMAEALASGRVDTLVEDIQAQMNGAVEGMNARYGGKYLFAGGQVDTKPVSAANLSDLTAPATVISDFFHNDQFQTQAKVDDSTTVTTGVLADAIGTPMLTGYKAMQAFHESGLGPFTGTLTPAQTSFLESQLTTWDTVRNDLTRLTAANGLVQNRVDSVKKGLTAHIDTLTGMMGDITDADMAEAATQLQNAQMSVQAAAQVFKSLQTSSLLNLLR